MNSRRDKFDVVRRCLDKQPKQPGHPSERLPTAALVPLGRLVGQCAWPSLLWSRRSWFQGRGVVAQHLADELKFAFVLLHLARDIVSRNRRLRRL